MKINYAVLTKQSVDMAITKAIKSAADMQRLVQLAAVSVLMHAAKCGDYSKAQVLVDGLHANGANAKALVEWFVKFGGLTVDEDAGTFSGWQGPEHIKANFDDAKSVLWSSFKAPSPYKGFDLDKALADLVKRAVGEAKKAEKDAERAALVRIDMDKLRAIEALVKGKPAKAA